MAEWRFFRNWSEKELSQRLEALKSRSSNFPLSGPLSQEGEDWKRYFTENLIDVEAPGLPKEDGSFYTAWKGIRDYKFSDPRIVEGYYDPSDPLEGRTILLKLKVFGLKYLCGARVVAVKEQQNEKESLSAFRYDTLEGHIEVGSEWFSLRKDHSTGKIWFRIAASWRPGEFPNWWTRVGFKLMSQFFQMAWHRLAYLRLRKLVGSTAKKLSRIPRGRQLIQNSDEVSSSAYWHLDEPAIKGESNSKGQSDRELT